MLRHRVGKAFGRQIAHVGRIQCPSKPCAHRFRDQVIPGSLEALQLVSQLANRDLINRIHFRKGHGMLYTIQQCHKTRHHIVNVNQLDHGLRIIDLYRQTPSDIVAKRSDGGVVIRLRPLAEYIWEAININRAS